MRKVILNLAVTLDGYISRLDDRVDFLDDLNTGDSDLGFTDFLASVDTLVMGRKSYDVTLELGKGIWPFENLHSYVFTRSERDDVKSVSFVNESLEDFLKNETSKEGKDIWLFGGSSFIKETRRLNLVDEYIITTVPVFIGKGIKLFDVVDNEVDLTLKEVSKINDIVQCHYIVSK